METEREQGPGSRRSKQEVQYRPGPAGSEPMIGHRPVSLAAALYQ